MEQKEQQKLKLQQEQEHKLKVSQKSESQSKVESLNNKKPAPDRKIDQTFKDKTFATSHLRTLELDNTNKE